MLNSAAEVEGIEWKTLQSIHFYYCRCEQIHSRMILPCKYEVNLASDPLRAILSLHDPRPHCLR